MKDETLRRLRGTCFGFNGCFAGECFESAVVALRFLAAAAPDDACWHMRQIDLFNAHFGDKKRNGGVLIYFALCLSELPYETAEPEIRRNLNAIAAKLSRAYSFADENSKTDLTVKLCVLRNALSRLDEFARIRDRQPYQSEGDGKLRFDMA